jgi:hypothetical protein
MVPPVAGAAEPEADEPAGAAGDDPAGAADGATDDDPAGAGADDAAAAGDGVDEAADDPVAVLDDEQAATELATAKAVKAVSAVRRTVEERVTLILPWMQFV